MVANRNDKIQSIKSFINWLDPLARQAAMLDDELVEEYANEVLTPCDTAIATGPGHQSTHPCIRTGSHKQHISGHHYEWYDKDITSQTGTQTRYPGPKHDVPVKTTYRLAFGEW